MENSPPELSSKDLLDMNKSEQDTVYNEPKIDTLDDKDRLPSESNEKEAEPVIQTPQENVVERKARIIDGYRVQIMATNSKNTALSIQNSLKNKGYRDVYLINEFPLFKIRVGNCGTRQEANLLRRRLINAGYRDSWIVETKIEKKEEK